jgi:hypothetical protein
MGRKKRTDLNQATHNDLKGFSIKINEFGEIKSTFPVDKLNLFLNHNINDKKLKDVKNHDEKK